VRDIKDGIARLRSEKAKGASDEKLDRLEHALEPHLESWLVTFEGVTTGWEKRGRQIVADDSLALHLLKDVTPEQLRMSVFKLVQFADTSMPEEKVAGIADAFVDGIRGQVGSKFAWQVAAKAREILSKQATSLENAIASADALLETVVSTTGEARAKLLSDLGCDDPPTKEQVVASLRRALERVNERIKDVLPLQNAGPSTVVKELPATAGIVAKGLGVRMKDGKMTAPLSSRTLLETGIEDRMIVDGLFRGAVESIGGLAVKVLGGSVNDLFPSELAKLAFDVGLGVSPEILMLAAEVEREVR